MIVIRIVSDSDKHFSIAVEEYLKRLGRDIKLERIKPVKWGSATEIIKKETMVLIESLKLSKSDHIVLLDDGGDSFSTEEFVTWIGTKEAQAKNILFLIGGAYGVDRALLEQHIDSTLSLSDFTLPHGLALLTLLEQIYRVKQIQKGSGYHH